MNQWQMCHSEKSGFFSMNLSHVALISGWQRADGESEGPEAAAQPVGG